MQKKNTQHKHIILACLFGMQEVKLLYELTQRIICIDSGTEKTCFKCLQTFSIHITWQRAETVAAINDIARNMWFCWWEQFGLGMHGFFTHSLMKWLILLKTQNVSIFKTSKQMVLQFWAFLKDIHKKYNDFHRKFDS